MSAVSVFNSISILLGAGTNVQVYVYSDISMWLNSVCVTVIF